MLPLDPALSIRADHWNGLVSEHALAVPFEDELHHIFKDTAASKLDGNLKNVAKAQAVIERQMGRRLARLRDRDGFIKLGFVRLGDYAAERLELGCRSAQEMARVGAALEGLPALRRASDEGRVSSSKVRELVRFVTLETEAEWVERAEALTVRGLRQEIKSLAQEGVGPDWEISLDTEDATAELRFEAPAWFSAKWETALDLFRKIEGREDLPAGAAAEAFAAEWQSGAESSDLNETESPGSPEEACLEWKDTAVRDCLDRAAVRNRMEQSVEECFKRWAYLDDKGRPALPAWLEAYNGELSDDPFVLDEELRSLEFARRELDGMAGRMLLTMARIGLFRPMGFVDIGHYARERLGMAPSTARRLKWIERWMFELPEVRKAYYAGEIGLARVGPLLRVNRARHMAAWVERAKGVTVRRLEQEVQLVLRRAALVESGLLPRSPGENLYEVLPEGTDLVRSMSALDEIAKKGPGETATGCETTAKSCEPTVTIRCTMEIEAKEFWQGCVDHCRALFGRNLLEWECADRFIDSFFAAHEREDPLRYALNHKTFERDGWRCQVPCCHRRGSLNSHHKDWKSHCGPDELDNLTAVCTMHHPALHEGFIEVEGTAPNALTWRLGVRENGEALLTVGPGEKVQRRGNSRGAVA
jgi:hypothetical protein